jgi:hypothetical protein
MIKTKGKIYYILVGVCFTLIISSIGLMFAKKDLYKQTEWSIGIYIGNSPFSLHNPDNIINPVLTAKDITDVSATYVADPFIIKENSTWYMFFEVANNKSKKGEIALAISPDGLSWKYKQIVLDEPFHLSFPYVFRWKNEYYMVPESGRANSIRLYKATEFPLKWRYVGDLLSGCDCVDNSLIRYKNKWWLFTTTSSKNYFLRLYYADDLMGPWKEHPKSPIVKGNEHYARSGGRMIIYQNYIIRYAQDGSPTYGSKLWAFKITHLTTKDYEEQLVSETPILKASGSGWNKEGMHQLDAINVGEKKWIAAVDGKSVKLILGTTNKFP